MNTFANAGMSVLGVGNDPSYYGSRKLAELQDQRMQALTQAIRAQEHTRLSMPPQKEKSPKSVKKPKEPKIEKIIVKEVREPEFNYNGVRELNSREKDMRNIMMLNKMQDLYRNPNRDEYDFLVPEMVLDSKYLDDKYIGRHVGRGPNFSRHFEELERFRLGNQYASNEMNRVTSLPTLTTVTKGSRSRGPTTKESISPATQNYHEERNENTAQFPPQNQPFNNFTFNPYQYQPPPPPPQYGQSMYYPPNPNAYSPQPPYYIDPRFNRPPEEQETSKADKAIYKAIEEQNKMLVALAENFDKGKGTRVDEEHRFLEKKLLKIEKRAKERSSEMQRMWFLRQQQSQAQPQAYNQQPEYYNPQMYNPAVNNMRIGNMVGARPQGPMGGFLGHLDPRVRGAMMMPKGLKGGRDESESDSESESVSESESSEEDYKRSKRRRGKNRKDKDNESDEPGHKGRNRKGKGKIRGGRKNQKNQLPHNQTTDLPIQQGAIEEEVHEEEVIEEPIEVKEEVVVEEVIDESAIRREIARKKLKIRFLSLTYMTTYLNDLRRKILKRKDEYYEKLSEKIKNSLDLIKPNMNKVVFAALAPVLTNTKLNLNILPVGCIGTKKEASEKEKAKRADDIQNIVKVLLDKILDGTNPNNYNQQVLNFFGFELQ